VNESGVVENEPVSAKDKHPLIESELVPDGVLCDTSASVNASSDPRVQSGRIEKSAKLREETYNRTRGKAPTSRS
jgi:hypothetical protein